MQGIKMTVHFFKKNVLKAHPTSTTDATVLVNVAFFVLCTAELITCFCGYCVGCMTDFSATSPVFNSSGLSSLYSSHLRQSLHSFK